VACNGLNRWYAYGTGRGVCVQRKHHALCAWLEAVCQRGGIPLPPTLPLGAGYMTQIFPTFLRRQHGISQRQLLLREERVNGRAREVEKRAAQL
jgi:hypothetical protein